MAAQHTISIILTCVLATVKADIQQDIESKKSLILVKRVFRPPVGWHMNGTGFNANAGEWIEFFASASLPRGLTCNETKCHDLCVRDYQDIAPTVIGQCIWELSDILLPETLFLGVFCCCHTGTTDRLGDVVAGGILDPEQQVVNGVDERIICDCNLNACKDQCEEYGFERDRSRCSQQIWATAGANNVRKYYQIRLCVCGAGEESPQTPESSGSQVDVAAFKLGGVTMPSGCSGIMSSSTDMLAANIAVCAVTTIFKYICVKAAKKFIGVGRRRRDLTEKASDTDSRKGDTVATSPNKNPLRHPRNV